MVLLRKMIFKVIFTGDSKENIRGVADPGEGPNPPPYLRVWMTAPLPFPLSEGLDPPLPSRDPNKNRTYDLLGRVVRRPVKANPGLNFKPAFFFFSSKAFSRKIFSILFRVANHQIVHKKN